MDGVVLRVAQSEDAEPLSRLGHDTFRETFLDGFAIPYPAADLTAFLERNYTPRAFATKLSDPLQCTWIVEREGAPIAYANAGPCGLPHPQADAAHLELHRLYILRAAQGLGLGRALLETAIDWMQDAAPGPMWLGVWSGNLKAQRLYSAYGFRKVGDYQFPVGAWRDDEFIFRKDRPSG